MGLTINYSFDSSVTALQTSDDTLYTEYTTAVKAAVAYFEAEISNPITVNLDFGWGELDGMTVSAAGESEALYNSFSYAQVLKGLQATDVTSAVQTAAVASLPSKDPTGGKGAFYVTYAEQLALGLTGGSATSSTLDGWVGLDDKLDWTWVGQSYTAGSYDAVAVLEHEISEDLGRVAEGGKDAFDDGKDDYTPLDLFRYTAASGSVADPAAPGTAVGSRDEPFAANYDDLAQSYFSYNGTTVTLPYDTPAHVAAGADVADWAPSVANDAFGYADASGASSVSTTDLEELNVLGYDMACYARGTRILTDRGEIAVEALRIGDPVVTASGALRPVVWIGRRRVDLSRHVRPERVDPVRIEAGALAAGVPARDLCVSPEHALWLDQALVCARDLINGATIRQEARRAVEYFHVELESHDILLAEGAPAESYLDCGNRNNFENGGDASSLHPEWATRGEGRPFASPSQLAAIRSRLAQRAADLGRAAELAAYRTHEQARAEAPRENVVGNPRGAGAAPGLIGEGGAAPAGWQLVAPPGVAIEIAGSGLEAGLPYVDVRFVGCAEAAGACAIYPSPGTAIAAARGQDWTFSAYLRRVGGDYAGVLSLSLYFDEYGPNGAYLDGEPRAVRLPNGDALALQRVSATHRMRRNDALSMTGYVQATIAAGVAIDLTLRIAGLQIEQGEFASNLLLPVEGGFGPVKRANNSGPFEAAA